MVIFLCNNVIDFFLIGKILENNLLMSFYKNNVLNYGKIKYMNMLIWGCLLFIFVLLLIIVEMLKSIFIILLVYKFFIVIKYLYRIIFYVWK